MTTLKLYLYASVLLAFIVSNIATGLWQHHEGTLAGAAALAQYKAAQAAALAQAATAAQQAQQQADAALLIQQQDKLAAAAAAAAQREAVVSQQQAKVQSLEADLHAIPSSDTAAATWLGPLPPSIRQALTAPVGGAK